MPFIHENLIFEILSLKNGRKSTSQVNHFPKLNILVIYEFAFELNNQISAIKF